MKNKRVYLEVVLECIDLIHDYTKGQTLDSFLVDRKTQDAVIRNLEVIGQALKDYGVEILAENSPNIPWKKIAGMRNVLAHEYLGVDLTLVWGTISQDLGILKETIKKILQNS